MSTLVYKEYGAKLPRRSNEITTVLYVGNDDAFINFTCTLNTYIALSWVFNYCNWYNHDLCLFSTKIKPFIDVDKVELAHKAFQIAIESTKYSDCLSHLQKLNSFFSVNEDGAQATLFMFPSCKQEAGLYSKVEMEIVFVMPDGKRHNMGYKSLDNLSSGIDLNKLSGGLGIQSQSIPDRNKALFVLSQYAST